MIDRNRHARRARQPVAFALDEGAERQTRVELRVDDDLLETRNYKRIFYICRVGLRVEARDVRRVGVGRYAHRRRRTRYGIVQPRLLTVELRDDGLQKRDVVLLDLVHIALVGYPQAQGRAVEFERYDGLEPFPELFGRSLGLDAVQAVLPHVAICLRVVEHDGGCTVFDATKL